MRTEREEPALVLVPVRETVAGSMAIRTGRCMLGTRIGLAFTSIATLRGTLGPAQQWIMLSVSVLRSMLTDLAIDEIRVDPLPAVSPSARRTCTDRPALPAAGPARPLVAQH
jgi:hypothetical protein